MPILFRKEFLLFTLLSIQILCHGQKVSISGNLVNCELDSIRLFEFDGSLLYTLASVNLEQGEGNYSFSMEMQNVPKGFYLLGGGQQNDTRLMILGGEENITLSGQCDQLYNAAIYDSEINQAYTQASEKANELQQSFSDANISYRKALMGQGDTESVVEEMARIDKEKLELLNSLKASQAFVSKVIALRTYLSFPNNGEDFNNEVEYFANSYFKYASLEDPDYNRIPFVYDAFRSYTSTLTKIGLGEDMQQKFLNMHLDKMSKGSRGQKLALIGALAGAGEEAPAAFVAMASRYIEDFGESNPEYARTLTAQTKRLQSRIPGAIAPEITLPNVDGDMVKLSDLRGKYVLIDFWASWCGPCRMENPNVVRVYEKYKDKGFEILGVSLDRSRQPWLNAIEKDGLGWHHVSDLKYFQTQAAMDYGVSAIPYTVLLDPEGKIVATRLRGASLEQKLSEIFGE